MPNYPQPIQELTKMKYNSPSGYVNVGKYIPPFEKVENGFGYMGVILQDYENGKLQCHICGKWFEIFNSHLLKHHKITSDEYKIKFGLSKSTALRSKKLRLKQSEVMTKLNKENPKCFNRSHAGFEKGNKWSANRKGKPKSLETKNKYGVCDLQIMDKVIKLSEKLNKTPSLVELRKEYGQAFITTLHSRYSSYISYCKEIGLTPLYSNYNPKYDKEYFIKKSLDKEPSIRLFTQSEGRALYRVFPNGINELKQEIQKIKLNKIQITN